MNVNQATKLIIVILLFMSVGGFQREGYHFLAICVASAVAGYAMVAIADCLYSLIEGIDDV